MHGTGDQLYNAWTGRHITLDSLRNSLPLAWSYVDEPMSHTAHARWVTMFRAAGFQTVPTNLPALTYPLTVYRGSTEQRARRMSWTTDRAKAVEHCARHAQHGEAWVFMATLADAGAVLAHLSLRGEQEVLVDPDLLGDIGRTTP